MQYYHNKNRSRTPTYITGDLVMIQRQVLGQPGESKKMLAKYKGPYVITEVLPNDRFRVQDLHVIQRTQKFYKGVVAIDQMKLYEIPGSDLSDEGSDNSQAEETFVHNKTDQRPIRNRQKPKIFEDYE